MAGAGAEGSHGEQRTQGGKDRPEIECGFVTSWWHATSSNATPPKPAQTVPPTEDKVLRRLSRWAWVAVTVKLLQIWPLAPSEVMSRIPALK